MFTKASLSGERHNLVHAMATSSGWYLMRGGLKAYTLEIFQNRHLAGLGSSLKYVLIFCLL